jgi:Domain of unknown function (DUF305)
MIPHHQNAVNMAKALLKTNTLECDDVRDEDNPNCVMVKIMFDIINGQNHQIQEMLKFLDAVESPRTDNCDVLIETGVSSASRLASGSRQRRRRTQAAASRSNEAPRRKLLNALEDAADIATHASRVLGHLLL